MSFLENLKSSLMLIDHADDHGVHGGGEITGCNTGRAAGGDQHLLADACAYSTVHGDDVFVGEGCVFDELDLKKLKTDQGVELVGGNDGSNYLSA